MKSKLILFASALSLSLTSCNIHYKGVTFCQINATQTFKENGHKVSHSLFIEKENRRFVWSLDCHSSHKTGFYFSFYGKNLSLKINEGFEYMTSKNETINLNSSEESSYYLVTGPIKIYISYQNSPQEVKNVIKTDYYQMQIAGKNWYSDPIFIH